MLFLGEGVQIVLKIHLPPFGIIQIGCYVGAVETDATGQALAVEALPRTVIGGFGLADTSGAMFQPRADSAGRLSGATRAAPRRFKVAMHLPPVFFSSQVLHPGFADFAGTSWSCIYNFSCSGR